MKSIRVFIFLFFLISELCLCQKIDVKGIVKDNQGNLVPFASVVFKKKNTNGVSFGTLVKEDGTFSISLESALYVLEISIVGIKPQTKIIDLTLGFSKVDLGVLIINTDVKLDEVVVKADKLQRIELDKKTYYPAKDLQLNGGSLIDVMQNLPSVQVEVDGAISIRGDANVQILIDGRLSGLTNTAALLRTIPLASIEKVEVITNPSSKYNAEGTGGIINVVLKKGKKEMLTGSLEVFSGIRINSGVNLNLNHGGKKVSWYYNGGLGYSEPKARSILEVDNSNISDVDTQQTTERILEQFYVLNNLGGKWNWNKQNTLGFDLTYRIADLNTNNAIIYSDFLDTDIFQRAIREDIETYTNDFLQGRVDYKLKLNDKGAEIEMGLVVQTSNEDGNSDITEMALLPQESILNEDAVLNSIKDRRNTQWIDWIQPIGEKAQIELGVRNRNTIIDNDFEVSRNSNGVEFIIPEFSDKTIYDENIFAIYGQFGKRLEKFSYQLGLRLESTTIDISTTTGNSNINYTDLFPSGFLEYHLKDEQSLRLSLSRRISRPRRNALVSFSSFRDARNILIGNPSVNPTYVIVSELGYNGNFSNSFSLIPTIFYRYQNDVQDFFVEQDVISLNGIIQDIFKITTVNIGNRNSLGLELSTSYKPLSWFGLYGEFLISYFNQTGQFENINYDSKGFDSAGRIHFNFEIFKNFRFQLQHRFQGGREQGQFRRRAIYRMDAALSKQMFGNKAMLTINAKDIFNTWKFNIITNGQGFNQELITQIRTPQLNVAFSYLFNQKKYKGKKGQQYDKLD